MPEEKNHRFELHKVYVKDMSFESPMAPNVFRIENATPVIDVQLNVGHESLGEDIYEALLIITVNGKLNEKDAFLAEVHQAGIYQITGLEPEGALTSVLEVTCPNMLFPFAREAINELIVRGGFPQFLLSPVNFEILYRERRRRDSDDVRNGGNGAGDPGEPAAEVDADGAST
ncbi:MAG: protein-export chaperone SecB [Arenicellales bacterium]